MDDVDTYGGDENDDNHDDSDLIMSVKNDIATMI
jgi:hypothetical protein